MDWQPLILTFKLAIVTTIVLMLIAIPLAYKLAYTNSKLKPVIETLVSMPLVLPPTVLGFYLLMIFSPSSSIGEWLNEYLGIQFLFSFKGLVLASVCYSLPFMVHPIQAGFSKVPSNLIEASYILGKSKLITLWKVILPNMKRAMITGIVLSFAHTIGEFGVVLMIGGNIPGKTKVASIAIYDEVEALNYGAAHTYSLILFVISFVILLMVYGGNAKKAKQLGKW